MRHLTLHILQKAMVTVNSGNSFFLLPGSINTQMTFPSLPEGTHAVKVSQATCLSGCASVSWLASLWLWFPIFKHRTAWYHPPRALPEVRGSDSQREPQTLPFLFMVLLIRSNVGILLWSFSPKPSSAQWLCNKYSTITSIGCRQRLAMSLPGSVFSLLLMDALTYLPTVSHHLFPSCVDDCQRSCQTFPRSSCLGSLWAVSSKAALLMNKSWLKQQQQEQQQQQQLISSCPSYMIQLN